MAPGTAVALSESPPLPEVLSWEAICERFPNEWVILIDMTHRDHRVAAGRVYAHDPEKRALREAGREAMHLRGVIGGFFTGPLRRPQS